MAISIVARESAGSITWDGLDSEVMKSGGPWTPAGLSLAIDQLCVRYDLPTAEQLDWEVLGDPELATFQAAAPCVYLAAAAVCALRTTSATPAIAFGAWSATDLAAHLMASAPPRLSERDLFTEPQVPQAEPCADPWASPPGVLVGELPEPGRLGALMWSSLLANPRIEKLADGVAVLRAGVQPPECASGTVGLADGPAGDSLIECAVELRASLLLEALGCGLDLLERETGARILVGEPMDSAFERRIMPGQAWTAVVPELPNWARTINAFGQTQADTVGLWQALAPVPPSPQAAAALRTRACLAHQLFALTAYAPALGWAALLSGTNDPGAVIAAARIARIHILPPTVQSPSCTWEYMEAPVPTVRAPLHIFADMVPIADEIARSYRLAGPFASVPDLVRRVPSMAAEPNILRELIELGALDSLCDRNLLPAHWSVVSDWCTHVSDPANPEPLLEGVALFAIPCAADAGDQESARWWERFVTDQTSLSASDIVSFAPEDGAVALKAAIPSGSRRWRSAEQDLIVMALRAGGQAVHAVIAATDDGGNNPRSIAVRAVTPDGGGVAAVWVDTALCAAPVGHVEVSVPLLGDRERDLERLRRVQTILAQHPGEIQVRLALMHGDSRRTLPRLDDQKVAWSGALIDDLEVLLGPNRVRLLTGS